MYFLFLFLTAKVQCKHLNGQIIFLFLNQVTELHFTNLQEMLSRLNWEPIHVCRNWIQYVKSTISALLDQTHVCIGHIEMAAFPYDSWMTTQIVSYKKIITKWPLLTELQGQSITQHLSSDEHFINLCAWKLKTWPFRIFFFLCGIGWIV